MVEGGLNIFEKTPFGNFSPHFEAHKSFLTTQQLVSILVKN